MTPFYFLKAIFHWISRFFEYIGWFLLLGWVALMTFGTLMRYVLKAPIMIQGDVVSLMLVVFCTFCFAPVFLNGEHIRVDLITRHLPRKLQDFLYISAEFLTALFCILICFSSFTLIKQSLKVGSTLPISDIPVAPFHICIPVGFGLFAIVLVLDMITRLGDVFSARMNRDRG